MRTPSRGSFVAWSIGLFLSVVWACGDTPVEPPPDVEVASIEVTAPVSGLDAIGQSVRLTTVVRDAGGNPVQANLVWTSSDPGVLVVDPTGEVTSVADGDARVTATVGGVDGGVDLSVLQVVTGLAFLRQPTETDAGQIVDTLAVAWVDALGVPVARATDPIALSLDGPNSSNYELIGGEERSAEAGIATFDDVAVEGPAGEVTFRAEAVGFAVGSSVVDIREIVPPFDDFQAADLVIGQGDFTSADGAVGRDRVGQVTGVTRVGTDGPLYIADDAHSRLIGYTSVPSTNGSLADFVIGQNDFTSSDADSILTAGTMPSPLSPRSDGERLFVTDRQNNRVLIWNEPPTGAGDEADVVVGQAVFDSNSRGTTRTTLSSPIDIGVGGDRLVVADEANNRVLIWNSVPTANGAPADLVLGQEDFTSAATGRSGSGMDDPAGVWTDGEHLIVVDRGNRRVLVWRSFPSANNQTADFVLGAAGLEAEAESTDEPSARVLFSPQGVTSDGRFIYVSDSDFNRILIFPFPTRSGMSAVGVLGQSDFTLVASDDPDQDGEFGPQESARTLQFPVRVDLIGERLYVSDYGNHRVLRFTPVR